MIYRRSGSRNQAIFVLAMRGRVARENHVSFLRFGCPFCGAVSEVDADQAGAEVACPACGGALVVPQAQEAAAELPSDVSFLDSAKVETIRNSLAGGQPRAAKAKLWQKPAGIATGDRELPPSAPELPQPLSPALHKPLSQTAGSQVVDLSSAANEDGYGESVSPRVEGLVRHARQQRRVVSNAVMLVGSIAILIGALLGLMALGR